MTADYYLTAQELADEMRLTVDALYGWRALNKGPRSTKRGRRVVYRRSDVDAWVAATEAATARGEQVAS